MENKIEFAPNVLLIDSNYVNHVVSDMRAHFSSVLHRELPPADLAILLECLGLDAGMRGTENPIQVILIYDAQLPKFTDIVPSDLDKELHSVAFQGKLGEFTLYSFQPSDMATREDLFTESLQLLGACKETKRVMAVPDETAYGKNLGEVIKEMKGKENITMFGMNPSAAAEGSEFQMLGFAVLQALGVRPEELR